MTGGGGERFLKIRALTAWEFRFVEDILTNDDSMTDRIKSLMSYKGVCRTSLATLGLLNIW